MLSLRRDLKQLAFLLMVVEAMLAGAAIAAGTWVDRAGRPTGPEAPIAAYAAAVAHQDLPGALDQLAPDLRPRAQSFVAWQLGNRYTILESAVRSEPILDRLLGKTAPTSSVIALLEIHNEDGTRWQATEELPVDFQDGRWYLLRVPLEPGD